MKTLSSLGKRHDVKISFSSISILLCVPVFHTFNEGMFRNKYYFPKPGLGPSNAKFADLYM